MTPEVEALITALRSLQPEQKSRIAQGIWNDADYHLAFSKLWLTVEALTHVVRSMDAKQKKEAIQGIWNDSECRPVIMEVVSSTVLMPHTELPSQTSEPPLLTVNIAQAPRRQSEPEAIKQ